MIRYVMNMRRDDTFESEKAYNSWITDCGTERSERYPLPVALATFAVALGYGTRRSHRQRSERSPNSRLCSRQPKEKFSLAVKESSELSIEHHWRGDCIKYH